MPPVGKDWSDEQIWEQLAVRLGHGQDGWQLTPGPIGAAEQWPEHVPGPAVEPHLGDPFDGLGLLDPVDGDELAFGRDEKEDAGAARKTLCF